MRMQLSTPFSEREKGFMKSRNQDLYELEIKLIGKRRKEKEHTLPRKTAARNLQKREKKG